MPWSAVVLLGRPVVNCGPADLGTATTIGDRHSDRDNRSSLGHELGCPRF